MVDHENAPDDVVAVRERRESVRYPARMLVRIDTQKKVGRLGLSKNLSRSGLLMITTSKFRIGESAKLQICLALPLESDLVVEARIVRLEVNRHATHDIHRFLCAVRFVEPLPCEFLVRLVGGGATSLEVQAN